MQTEEHLLIKLTRQDPRGGIRYGGNTKSIPSRHTKIQLEATALHLGALFGACGHNFGPSLSCAHL